MKILEIRESKIDSNLLLVFTGLIIASGIELIENFIGRLILLFSSTLDSLFLVRFYYSYVFQLLLILGLIYLIRIIKRAKTNKEDGTLIYLNTKHFILLGVTVIILVIVNRLMEYLLSGTNANFYKFSMDYSLSIMNMGLYYFLNVADKILPFLKGLLVMIIFFMLIKK